MKCGCWPARNHVSLSKIWQQTWQVLHNAVFCTGSINHRVFIQSARPYVFVLLRCNLRRSGWCISASCISRNFITILDARFSHKNPAASRFCTPGSVFALRIARNLSTTHLIIVLLAIFHYFQYVEYSFTEHKFKKFADVFVMVSPEFSGWQLRANKQ